MKVKTMFSCKECGATSTKWAGRCTACEAWNVIEQTEVKEYKENKSRAIGYAGTMTAEITQLNDISVTEHMRISLECAEFDRVLGGGLVAGSVVMLGGDPGIGKTTLLLQALAVLAKNELYVLYVTGEESLDQIALRASQIKLASSNMYLLAETHVEKIIDKAVEKAPTVMVIDSIQTVYTSDVSAAPGCVSQVRESAMRLVQYAKKTGTIIFLVGHVTKEGALAGPRVLEHIVDTVLYFEGDKNSKLRMIRSIKNRFGAASELGVFAMTDSGLKAVSNPSAIFLTKQKQIVAGCVVMIVWEGTRPLLLELQALLDDSSSASSGARRLTLGVDSNRVSMMLALIHRYLGMNIHSQDIFINVVGGIKVVETSVDLALVAAIISSYKDRPIAHDTVVFGELGLGGEVRPVPFGQVRIIEAVKHGFKKIIVPAANMPKTTMPNIEIIAVNNIKELLAHI
jgi:DNA repair protein RadA/Sms